ncbi:MAG TPA: hypothetical protein VGS08_02145 [Candidatus Saccharimonadales bacterium]|nr:hypothetical protein [Candidatus Saccharimonadales bacterium]
MPMANDGGQRLERGGYAPVAGQLGVPLYDTGAVLPVRPNLVYGGAPVAENYLESPLARTLRERNELLRAVQEAIGSSLLGRSKEDDPSGFADQEYSHSTRLLGIVGELAVRGALESFEGRVAVASLRECYDASLIEMLHTDKEFRNKLEINRERKHLIVGSCVMALDGKTKIFNMCVRGEQKAREEAEADLRMLPVAERCAADVRTAEAVERLPVRSVHIGLSVDPKEAMQMYGEKFFDDLGFRKDLGFIQWYYRIDENTLLAATYSIDNTDLEMLRGVWEEFGGAIPAGESTNTWLDHAIQTSCSLDEARKTVCRIRERFYERMGITTRRHSVDEFVAANKSINDRIFNSLYLQVAVAQQTKQKGLAIHQFVDGLLQNPEHLNSNVHRQLRRMHSTATLDNTDIKLLEQLTRYAAAEHLRDGLRFLDSSKPGYFPATSIKLAQSVVRPSAQFMQGLAGGVIDGVRARRTYGGCTKSADLFNHDGTDSPDDLRRPQDAFGGNDEGPESTDNSIPNKIKCIKCGLESKKEAVVHKDYWECPHCRYWLDVCTGADGYRTQKGERITSDRIWKNIAKFTKPLIFTERSKTEK